MTSSECRMLACRVCTDPGCEHACHLTALAPAPAVSANRSPAGTDVAEAAGGAAGAAAVAGEAPRPFQFCRPDWWGEHGCRIAGETGHVCVDVFGRPPAETRRPCVAEARSAMAELFETYQAAAG